MKKQLGFLLAGAMAAASIVFGAPAAHAQPGTTLVPDDKLAACFADAIGAATGTTPDWATNGITTADIAAWQANGGVDNNQFSCTGVAILTGIDLLPYTTASNQYLSLTFGSISNVSPLAALTNLWYLDLSNNAIMDATPLGTMTSLDTLLLAGNQISDVSPLVALTNLTTLGLENNSISTVAPLAVMSSLRSLYLEQNNLNDPTSLAALTGLTTLRLSSTGSYSGVFGTIWLQALDNLVELRLDNDLIGNSEIANLFPLTKLQFLALNNNQIDDISVMAGFADLQTLLLNQNPVSDLSPLSGLTNLAYIQISDTGVSDLSPLALSFSSIAGKYATADVSSNQIADFSPLHPCTQAQLVHYQTADCTQVNAVAQTLTATAVTGTAQALPAIVAQPDDLVTWRVTGGAPLPTIAGGKVTFKAPGTYVLQFQDQPGTSSEYLFAGDATDCALQNATDYSGYCGIRADFSGIVTFTVTQGTSGPGYNTGGSLAPSALTGIIIAVVLVLAGAAAVIVFLLRRRRGDSDQEPAATTTPADPPVSETTA